MGTFIAPERAYQGIVEIPSFSVNSIGDLNPYLWYDIGLSGLPDGPIYTINDLSGNNFPALYSNQPAIKNGDRLIFNGSSNSTESYYSISGLNFSTRQATAGIRIYNDASFACGFTTASGQTSEWRSPTVNDASYSQFLSGTGRLINQSQLPKGSEITYIIESSDERWNLFLNGNLHKQAMPSFSYSQLRIGDASSAWGINGYLKKLVIFNRILNPWEMREFMRLL